MVTSEPATAGPELSSRRRALILAICCMSLN